MGAVCLRCFCFMGDPGLTYWWQWLLRFVSHCKSTAKGNVLLVLFWSIWLSTAQMPFLIANGCNVISFHRENAVCVYASVLCVYAKKCACNVSLVFSCWFSCNFLICFLSSFGAVCDKQSLLCSFLLKRKKKLREQKLFYLYTLLLNE